ncbi:MAG: ABC transporter permease [Gemmatimonadota bacterium]
MSALRRRLLTAAHRRPALGSWSLLAPGVGWLVVFFAVPLSVMLIYSVLERGTYGGVEWTFTLESYRRFFDPLYFGILRRSFVFGALTTAACLALGYPMAYAIARSGRWRHLLLFLVILPFWTSFLIRTYAIIFLMRDTGLLNTALLAIGLLDEPIPMLYTPGAVLVGLVYGYLPFMVLPLYASIEKLDPSLLEAAEVLGARPAARFFRVTVPLTWPGIVAGGVLVFIPSLGAFLTPDLLGGAKTMMMGNLVQQQFGAARDWPFGSAASFILMAVVLALFWVYARRRDAGATAAG